jgi:hypothetical protein
MAPNVSPIPGPVPLETRQADIPGLPHDNYGPHFNAAIWVLTGLAAVFLALRMYCKRIRRKNLWWDDLVLIASFVSLVIFPVSPIA